MRSMTIPLGAVALVAGLTLSVPLAATQPAAAPRQTDGLEVYIVEGPTSELGELAELGIDTHHVTQESAGAGEVRLELVVTGRQAAKVRDAGFTARVKKIDGKKASEAARAQQRAGYDAYRSWSEEGGIADELRATAAANPTIAKLVTIGRTLQGKEILALKVTKNARKTKDGSRKAVLYGGAQHAREWITPEMVRRLMHHFLDGYGTDPTITGLVNTTELWFLPVSNPDGYDFTFTEGNRLWRKNMRDNNGDGIIADGDGVDPNRNFATKWGWDNEGSSTDPASETFRGRGPASEPETQALDALFERVGFEFYINYHSAAELLLYGIGWQVSTPSPDDVIYEAMAGDDANPAVPGYDPDISAELYTTNGDTDSHATVAYGTLGFTPEMTTCETVVGLEPRRRVAERGLRQRLQLPRRRGADPGGVREEHPVRDGRRLLHERPGRPGLGGRARHPGDGGRPVRGLARPHPAGRGHREAGPEGPEAALPRQRRRHEVGQDHGLERRRAVRRHPPRLLRGVPGQRHRDPAG